MKTKIGTPFLVVCFFVLSSCTFITGEGPVLEKGFAKPTFQGVELDGSFNVNINQGAQQHVVVNRVCLNPCGLDTGGLLAEDVGPDAPRRGDQMLVGRTPGIGLEATW